MRCLDALEQLRNQAYPYESIQMRRLEVLQRFKVSVRDERLHISVSFQYASEKHFNNPPPLEDLRVVFLEYIRMPRKSEC